jgi:hypothetical protein
MKGNPNQGIASIEWQRKTAQSAEAAKRNRKVPGVMR